MNNRNFRGNRPQRVDPTEFPAVINYKRDAFVFDFQILDQTSFEEFKLNFRNIDSGALKALVAGGKAVTGEDLRTVLVTGARFTEKLANDGDKEICAACGRENQPVIKPREGKDPVGAFEIYKGARLSDLNAIAAARGTETTARLAASASQPVPTKALAIEWCQGCKRLVQRDLEDTQKAFDKEGEGKRVRWPHYLTREAAIAELFEADQRISNSQNRMDFIRGVNDMRRGAGPRSDNRGETNRTGQRVGGGMRGNRGARTEREQADFYGAKLWKTQVEALEKAGIKSLEELKDTSIAKLIELGVAQYEGQAANLLKITAAVIERQAKQQATAAAAGSEGFNLAEVASVHDDTPSSGRGKGRGTRQSKKADKGEDQPRAKRGGGRPTPRSSRTSLNED